MLSRCNAGKKIFSRGRGELHYEGDPSVCSAENLEPRVFPNISFHLLHK